MIPGRPLAETSPDILIWSRNRSFFESYDGKLCFFGHTPTQFLPRSGRNRRFGREIILKNILSPFASLDALISKIDTIGYLPEGAVAAKHAWQLCFKHSLKLSIIPLVYKILNKEINPVAALKHLLEAHVRSLMGTDAAGVEHSDIVKEYEYAGSLIAYWKRTDPAFRDELGTGGVNLLFADVSRHLADMTSDSAVRY